MVRLVNLMGAVILPEQVMERHYFLETLNNPEFVWGIRAVGVMSAILTVFLYLKLKETADGLIMVGAKTSEAALSNGATAAVDGFYAADMAALDYPVLDLDTEQDTEQMSEVSSESDVEQVPEVSSESDTVQVSEVSSESDAEQVPGSSPEPEDNPVPDMESESGGESEVADVPVTEHTSEQKTEIKFGRKSAAAFHIAETIRENDILLLTLLGVSIGGLILLTCVAKRKRVKDRSVT